MYHSDIHETFDEPDVRRVFASMSDATNTAIRLANAAAQQACGILNHVRARGSYITGMSIVGALYDVTVSKFRLH
jgi:hypothetical protein